MKIFTGEKPKNPCEKCHHNSGDCINCKAAILYQSILNQCVEVDLDELYHKYNAYRAVIASGGKCCVNYDSFSQFVQSEIKKQEGK
jgi:hypothetical protein